MKIRQDNVEISDNNIILLRDNEWNQKQYKKLYMFEKEFKVEETRSKRYRYKVAEFGYLLLIFIFKDDV